MELDPNHYNKTNGITHEKANELIDRIIEENGVK